MEYLDGCTLAEIVAEEGRLPVAWVVDILEQVCAAVEEAHRAGIIHRDLKPDNIWLEPNGRGGRRSCGAAGPHTTHTAEPPSVSLWSFEPPRHGDTENGKASHLLSRLVHRDACLKTLPSRGKNRSGFLHSQSRVLRWL